MALLPLSRNLLKSTHAFLTKIPPLAPTSVQKQQRTCTRHLSSGESSQEILSSNNLNDKSIEIVNLQKITASQKRFVADQEELFADPSYFQTPVLMLHCSWTDFAVSFHSPDKLVTTFTKLSKLISVNFLPVIVLAFYDLRFI